MQIKDFDTLLSEKAAAVQGASAKLVDLSIGSVLRALLESETATVMWLQGTALEILTLYRAATSSGADLDSFMADFNIISRVPAQPSLGNVVFSRATTGHAASIPVGAQVQTADGSQQFAVVADATNPAYDSGTNAYIVGSSTASVTVPVQALTAGAASNVGPGLISLLSTAIPYIDSVTNPSAMGGGADAESDVALRNRFVLEINNRARGTKAAIASATQSVSSAITHSLVENVDAYGAARPGYFYDYVDDGSGATPSATLDAVNAAVDAVRAFTVGFAVVAASELTATVAISIIVSSGYSAVAVRAAVQAAVESYINKLKVGETLYYAQVGIVAGGVAGVASVTSVTLNGGSSNLDPADNQVIRYGSVTVTS